MNGREDAGSPADLRETLLAQLELSAKRAAKKGGSESPVALEKQPNDGNTGKMQTTMQVSTE